MRATEYGMLMHGQWPGVVLTRQGDGVAAEPQGPPPFRRYRVDSACEARNCVRRVNPS